MGCEHDASVSGEHGALALLATHWLADGLATGLDGIPGLWAAEGDLVRVTAVAADALLVDGVRLLGLDALSKGGSGVEVPGVRVVHAVFGV